MHPRSRWLLSTFLAAAAALFSAGPASAASLTVYLTAHVVVVSDPANALGGSVTVGQNVTGQYTYDTSVPFNQGNDNYPEGINQASLSFTAGSTVFSSDPTSPNWSYFIQVVPAAQPGYGSNFTITSQGNKPLPNGASLDMFQIRFSDSTGRAPTSSALPTQAPDLTQYSSSTVAIGGSYLGNSYSVELAIDSASTVPPPSGDFVISPPTGTFAGSGAQRFDVALILPAGVATVQSVSSTVGGQPGPFSYPGYCSLNPANSKGEQVILCPDAQYALPGGTTHVDWNVQLTDGTVLAAGVDWEFIP